MAGLCETCHWCHRVKTRRGSEFFRCIRASFDPRMERYPRLPVLECAGFAERPGRGRSVPAAADEDERSG